MIFSKHEIAIIFTLTVLQTKTKKLCSQKFPILQQIQQR